MGAPRQAPAPPAPPTVVATPPPINAYPPPANAMPPATGTLPLPQRDFERIAPSVPVAAPIKPGAAPQVERVAVAASPAGGRPILPLEKLRLEGEIDGRSWAVFLTQEEAAAAATLTIAYTNSVVVMPEASRFRVSLNGEAVFEAPIASPGAVATVRVQVRRNLLRPGANRIRFEVAQRHRTDCTVDATYELWTEFDGARTALTFADVSDRQLRTLDDLPAVGHAVNGTTTLLVVAPGSPGAQIADRVLRAVQAVAIRGRFQHLVVKVGEAPQAAEAGALTFVIGTASELRDRVDGLPGEAATRPWIGFAVDRRLGSAILIASGPSQAEVESAIEALAGPTERPAGVPRTEVDTITWRAPDAPLIVGERSVRLVEPRHRHAGIFGPALSHRILGRPAGRFLRGVLRRGGALSRRRLRPNGEARQPLRRLRQWPHHRDAAAQRRARRHLPALSAQAPPAQLQGGHQRRRHRERAAHRRRRAMPAGWNPARPEPLRSLRHDRAEISRIWPYRPHARSRCPVGLRISVSHRGRARRADPRPARRAALRGGSDADGKARPQRRAAAARRHQRAVPVNRRPTRHLCRHRRRIAAKHPAEHRHRRHRTHCLAEFRRGADGNAERRPAL